MSPLPTFGLPGGRCGLGKAAAFGFGLDSSGNASSLLFADLSGAVLGFGFGQGEDAGLLVILWQQPPHGEGPPQMSSVCMQVMTSYSSLQVRPSGPQVLSHPSRTGETLTFPAALVGGHRGDGEASVCVLLVGC